jgi:hypothetical protein
MDGWMEPEKVPQRWRRKMTILIKWLFVSERGVPL